MRVISGHYKGRHLVSPKNHRTHPMGDKVRAALFSVLGDINGLEVLDAFTGSGALAIEALSRGVSAVTAIDIDARAIAAIRHNVALLGLEQSITIIHAPAERWSSEHSKKQFGLVLLNPPYDSVDISTLQQLSGHVARGDGTLVLSVPEGFEPVVLPSLELVVAKKYGYAELRFYKRV